jgi:hypothetical protein
MPGNAAVWLPAAADFKASSVPAGRDCAARRPKQCSKENSGCAGALQKSKSENAHIVVMRRFTERHVEQLASRNTILISTQ